MQNRLRRRGRDSKRVFWVFVGHQELGLTQDFGCCALGVAEEVGGPEAMKFPALGFVDERAKKIPFHRIVGLRISGSVAENSQRDILWAIRMVKSEIDAETFVAPVDVGGGFVS